MGTLGLEKPPHHGYMDSPVADGPGSAKVMRELVRNANLQVVRGGHLVHHIHLVFPKTPTESPRGAARAFGSPWYNQIFAPVPIVKKPELTRAKWRVRAIIEGTATFHFQLANSFGGYDATKEDGSNVLEMVGDGSGNVQVFTLEDIPISRGPIETFGYFLKGGLTANAYAGAGPVSDFAELRTTFGPSATGTNGFTTAVDAALWESNIDERGIYVVFDNQPGEFVITGKTTNNILKFFPGESAQVDGATFNLFQLAEFQIVSSALYLMDEE